MNHHSIRVELHPEEIRELVTTNHQMLNYRTCNRNFHQINLHLQALL